MEDALAKTNEDRQWAETYDAMAFAIDDETTYPHGCHYDHEKLERFLIDLAKKPFLERIIPIQIINDFSGELFGSEQP